MEDRLFSRDTLAKGAPVSQFEATSTTGGAGLDVTDPEPLPTGHPLWTAPNTLITPHVADTEAMVVPLFAERVGRNVAAFLAGRPLEGRIDPAAGY